MKKTTLFALLVICILTMPTFAKYSGGTGQPTDPYLISTPEDINQIGANPADWDKHFLLTNDIDMAGFTYTTALIAPDTSSSSGFQGIVFTGTFDGNECKITGLTIDTAGIGNDYLGLFGYMHSPAELKNLGVEDVNITGGNRSDYLGGLVGFNDEGTISNCFSTGQVTGGGSLGGLVGFNDEGTISDCFSTGSVTGRTSLGGLVGKNSGTISNCYSTGSVNGGSSHRLGGLVGENRLDGTITNCYATGSVTGGASLGGLAGRNSGTISNCYATGSVTSGGFSRWLGGLVGYNGFASTISNCFSTGSVTGGDNSRSLGGLVGYNHNDVTISNCYAIGSVTAGDNSRWLGGLVGYNDRGTISNCYAAGSVSGGDNSRDLGGLAGNNYYGTISDCFSAGSVTGENRSRSLGGLVGGSGGTISNCYSTGSVAGGDSSHSLGGLAGGNSGPIIDCFSTGSVTGGDYSDFLGGLAGYNAFGTISNSYATGSVTGGDNSESLGGLVGHNSRNNGIISNCYSTGQVTAGDGSRGLGGLVGYNGRTISDCYSTGSVTGGDWSYYLGGLAGYNGDKISDCYSTGSVTGGNESYSLGGLVGRNYRTISNCFWDIETGSPDNGIGTGLPTAEMQIKSTFTDAGWDFTTPVWKICETVDYPHLAWQRIPAPVLYPEPDITTGTQNTITWQEVNEAGQYYAVCCNDPNLENVIMDTGWIDANEVTFAGLDIGRTYYYAVKARQNCVMESDFSNVESSMQVTLSDAVDAMLDPNTLKNANMANALSNKIDEVLAMIDAGNYQAALKKLKNDILGKTDGCANSGEPDKNDWIETCQQQAQIYPLIMETIEYVKSLIE